MTLAVVRPTTLPETADSSGTNSGRPGWSDLRRFAPEASVFAAAAWFLVAVARSWGGRESHVVSIGLLLLLAAVAIVRPWRILPLRMTVLGAAVAVCAVLVALVAPSGWAGAPVAASYVSAATLALLVAAVVMRRPTSVVGFGVLIAAAGGIEFAEAWFPWWGGQVSSEPMIGTFYWHNPFAAFLAPTAIVGLVLWIAHRRVLAALGCVAFTLATVGVMFSTSRASLACLAAGVLVVGVVTVRGSDRLRAGGRLLAAAGVATAASVVLAGPPFFPARASAAAAIADRTAGQSLGQNGGYRLEFWREALSVFGHHPLVGGGYHSLVAESVGRVPSEWPLSPYAHNGYLQVLSSGGLLLGIPVLLALLALVALTLRRLGRSLRRPTVDLAGLGIPVALGVVLLHAFVDFDWSYPANRAMLAVLGGVVAAGWLRARDVDPARRSIRWVLPVAALAVAAAAGAVGAWHGDLQQNLPTRDRPNVSFVKESPDSTDTDGGAVAAAADAAWSRAFSLKDIS